MTTLTIELPEATVAILRAQANMEQITLEEYVQDCLADFTISDESALAPLDLTPEEVVAVKLAQADLAAGRTVSHDEAMAHFRAALAR